MRSVQNHWRCLAVGMAALASTGCGLTVAADAPTATATVAIAEVNVLGAPLVVDTATPAPASPMVGPWPIPATPSTTAPAVVVPASAVVPPRRPPPVLYHPSIDPTGLIVREGETARFAVVLANAENEPITIRGLPPAVTLLRAIGGVPRGEAVRTFGGGTAEVTLARGGSYRYDVVWDMRRDDGTPVPPGRYSVSLSTLWIDYAGGQTIVTSGIGGRDAVVVHPAGGVRTGTLPLGARADDGGSVMVLDRLVLEPREAQLEAHAVPAWPESRSRPGSPIGDWNVSGEYRLDGGPPIPLGSPGFGIDDPSRTSFVWDLDPFPTASSEIDLTVRVSGDLTRRWTFRVRLPP